MLSALGQYKPVIAPTENAGNTSDEIRGGAAPARRQHRRGRPSQGTMCPM